MNTTLTRNAWWQLILSQWLNLVRTPAYSLPSLLFPVMFYAFFGLVMIRSQSLYLLCTFATFGVMGAALFAFGVGIATERARGWLLLLRASPAPLPALVAGKTFGAVLFALLITVSMCVLAGAFGEVRLPAGRWFALVGVLAAGTLPFALLGLALGLWLSPNAAPAVINILYLPLAFLSGLWVPVSQFPVWLQDLAAWLPPYHLAGLALHVTGALPGSWTTHLLVLILYTVVFGALTAAGWRRFTGV